VAGAKSGAVRRGHQRVLDPNRPLSLSDFAATSRARRASRPNCFRAASDVSSFHLGDYAIISDCVMSLKTTLSCRRCSPRLDCILKATNHGVDDDVGDVLNTANYKIALSVSAHATADVGRHHLLHVSGICLEWRILRIRPCMPGWGLVRARSWEHRLSFYRLIRFEILLPPLFESLADVNFVL
jgi:hypothetical protein